MGICTSKYVIPRGSAGDGMIGARTVQFGSAAAQGRRPYMEDCVGAGFAKLAGGDSELAYAAIFDGHGGSRVAEYCTTNLFDTLVERVANVKHMNEIGNEDLTDLVIEVFMDVDARIAALPPMLAMERSGCPCSGSHEELRDIGFVGSTAAVVFLTPERIIFANTGDSRALLLRNGEVFFSTMDHSPNDPAEIARIEAAGSFVESGRVGGILGVARALGDSRFKMCEDVTAEMQAVTARPDVTIFPRSSGDQFVVIASDGVWDCMEDEEMAEFVLKFLVDDGVELDIFCEILLDECINRRFTGDNTSIIVLDLISGALAEASISGSEDAISVDALSTAATAGRSIVKEGEASEAATRVGDATILEADADVDDDNETAATEDEIPKVMPADENEVGAQEDDDDPQEEDAPSAEADGAGVNIHVASANAQD